MAAGVASAQDINKAIELANSGNEAFQMGEYALAIDAFKESLSIAEEFKNVIAKCTEKPIYKILLYFLYLDVDEKEQQTIDIIADAMKAVEELMTTLFVAALTTTSSILLTLDI